MIIIYDVETCGLFPRGSHYSKDFDSYPHIVQLAYIICDDEGNEIERYNELVKPDGYEIPKESTEIHGITTEIAVKKGKPIKEVFRSFVPKVDKCEKLVAHNIFYDTSIIKANILKLGIPIDPGINKAFDKSKRVDTMHKSTNFCNLPGKFGVKWPKLEELYKKLFDKEMDNAHNAIADVEATKECYFKLKRLRIIN